MDNFSFKVVILDTKWLLFTQNLTLDLNWLNDYSIFWHRIIILSTKPLFLAQNNHSWHKRISFCSKLSFFDTKQIFFTQKITFDLNIPFFFFAQNNHYWHKWMDFLPKILSLDTKRLFLTKKITLHSNLLFHFWLKMMIFWTQNDHSWLQMVILDINSCIFVSVFKTNLIISIKTPSNCFSSQNHQWSQNS